MSLGVEFELVEGSLHGLSALEMVLGVRNGVLLYWGLCDRGLLRYLLDYWGWVDY